MNNNDILRRLRYTFDFSDAKMVEIFAHAEHLVTREQVMSWLKKEGDPELQECIDTELSIFLNGLIIDRRGRQEGEIPKPDVRLNNNIVFRKLKIALDLKADDILEILALADMPISKHELSAFFRKPGHKNYRGCNDQILRNFMQGMQLKFRGQVSSESSTE